MAQGFEEPKEEYGDRRENDFNGIGRSISAQHTGQTACTSRGAAEDRVRGDERGTKAQRRRTVGPQGTGARQDPEGNGEVAASRDPARDSLPMGKEPRDRLRLQVSRSDAGGGVDGSVGVRVGGPPQVSGGPTHSRRGSQGNNLAKPGRGQATRDGEAKGGVLPAGV